MRIPLDGVEWQAKNWNAEGPSRLTQVIGWRATNWKGLVGSLRERRFDPQAHPSHTDWPLHFVCLRGATPWDDTALRSRLKQTWKSTKNRATMLIKTQIRVAHENFDANNHSLTRDSPVRDSLDTDPHDRD